MKTDCPHCHAVLELVGGRAPAFCAFCGRSLGDSGPTKPAPVADVPTLPPRGADSTAPYDAATTPISIEKDPETIGGYRLLRAIGQGGMGTVYEAEDPQSGRRVAVKLVAGKYTAKRDALERFRREGKLAGALVHPRCVFVAAADEEAGRPYIVMELMPGETLEGLVRQRGPLPVAEAVDKILDVIDGLREAHQLGVIHRDMKPSNCFLEVNGRVKVGDFGLARSLAGGDQLTVTGTFLGTPQFASPEQVRGDPLTPQTDVYSVAATLYYLLSGKAPFQGSDAAGTLARIVADDPPPLTNVPTEVDAVVHRGLARDRQQRFQDLDEFRLALLPFLPGRSSFVSLGVRFGANLIDTAILTIIGILLGLSGTATGGGSGMVHGRNPLSDPQTIAAELFGTLAFFLYYAPEWIWGASLGKHLLGVRVCRLTTTSPPGFWRGLLRSAIFYVVRNGLSLVGLALFASMPTEQTPEAQSVAMQRLLLGSMLSFIGIPLGIGLICCTMRNRNGLRGLHDFATGTRVVLTPRPPRPPGVRGQACVRALSQPADLPHRIGPFGVKGALRWAADEGILLAEDATLGREVLIWIRSPSAPSLDTPRRDCCRMTRLRWLTGGRTGDRPWDAFPAPTGCSLRELVAAIGPIAWPDARRLLEDLTNELTVAEREKTLPQSPSLDQVWVQPNGRLLLLDVPLTESATQVQEADARTGLDLLREVAELVVCGRPGPFPPPPEGIGQPLPLHVVELLGGFRNEENRFARVAEVRAALRDTRDRPVEVTRPRRAGQLGMLAGFLLFGLGFCMAPVGLIIDSASIGIYQAMTVQLSEKIDNLERGARRDFLLSAVNPDPAVRITGVAVYRGDVQTLEQLRAQEERLKLQREASINSSLFGPTMRETYNSMAQAGAKQKSMPPWTNPLYAPSGFRWSAQLDSEDDVPQMHRAMMIGSMIALLFWPTVWVLWAVPTRGGFSYSIAGLALVRRDGRKAGHLRCGWRALLVWGPVAALLAGSALLNGWYWMHWEPAEPHSWAHWLSRLTWWTGWALLAAYVGLALRSPARAPSDRLAGTWLVPK